MLISVQLTPTVLISTEKGIVILYIVSYFGVAGESGGTFHAFREEEIAELLPKKVARVAKITLNG